MIVLLSIHFHLNFSRILYSFFSVWQPTHKHANQLYAKQFIQLRLMHICAAKKHMAAMVCMTKNFATAVKKKRFCTARTQRAFLCKTSPLSLSLALFLSFDFMFARCCSRFFMDRSRVDSAFIAAVL